MTDRELYTLRNGQVAYFSSRHEQAIIFKNDARHAFEDLTRNPTFPAEAEWPQHLKDDIEVLEEKAISFHIDVALYRDDLTYVNALIDITISEYEDYIKRDVSEEQKYARFVYACDYVTDFWQRTIRKSMSFKRDCAEFLNEIAVFKSKLEQHFLNSSK